MRLHNEPEGVPALPLQQLRLSGLWDTYEKPQQGFRNYFWIHFGGSGSWEVAGTNPNATTWERNVGVSNWQKPNPWIESPLTETFGHCLLCLLSQTVSSRQWKCDVTMVGPDHEALETTPSVREMKPPPWITFQCLFPISYFHRKFSRFEKLLKAFPGYFTYHCLKFGFSLTLLLYFYFLLLKSLSFLSFCLPPECPPSLLCCHMLMYLITLVIQIVPIDPLMSLLIGALFCSWRNWGTVSWLDEEAVGWAPNPTVYLQGLHSQPQCHILTLSLSLRVLMNSRNFMLIPWIGIPYHPYPLRVILKCALCLLFHWSVFHCPYNFVAVPQGMIFLLDSLIHSVKVRKFDFLLGTVWTSFFFLYLPTEML